MATGDSATPIICINGEKDLGVIINVYEHKHILNIIHKVILLEF